MGLFLTSGFPTPEDTLPVLRSLDRGGADFIELGMPFSDPLAEGLPIQRSSARALAQGVRMEDTFRTAEAFVAESDTPLLLMGYVNPVLRYGVEEFCRDARAAGVAGVILPDLPPQRERGIGVSSLLKEHAQLNGLSLVFLIAPNTMAERIRAVDDASAGFVYAVSVTGVTGSTLDQGDAVDEYLKRARSLVRKNPLLVGFGIRSHEDAVRLSRHTDGFIAGSACIELIEKLWDDDSSGNAERYERVETFVQELKYGANHLV